LVTRKQDNKIVLNGQVLVAHAYNLSYSVSRDQKDCDLKPAQANTLRDPILKKTHHKELVEWLKV
jgi:hypothetical protein